MTASVIPAMTAGGDATMKAGNGDAVPAAVARDEVLHWMARTGGSPLDAAKEFFPGAHPAEQKKKANLFAQWKRRHGLPASPSTAPSKPSRGPPATGNPFGGVRMPPVPSVVGMSTVARFEWQLERIAGAVEHAMVTGDVKAMASAMRQMTEIGQALDRAREAEGKVAALDRTAENLAKRINLLGETLRRVQRHSRHKASAEARRRDL